MDIKKIDSSQYRELTDIEHVIQRATVYIGSTKEITGPQYVFFGDGKIHLDNITYVNGALVLASELINNAYDEFVKRKNDPAKRNITNIDVVVNLKNKSLTVRDNGGIQIALHTESGLLLPSFIFGKMRTGGNYNDDDREDIGGLNGMGSKLANIFSHSFHIKVHEAGEKYYFQQTWKDSSRETYQYDANVDKESYKALLHPCEPSNEGMVEVIAEFDTTMMPETAYTMQWARMIEMRCCLIAAMAAIDNSLLTVSYTCIPEEGEPWTIPFQFNNFQDYLALYPQSESYIVDKHPGFSLAMNLSSGQLESVGCVNGLRCDRGTHIKRYTEACAFHIREHIKLKHNVDVKPAKIISHMKVISAFKINAPEFGGQTKEELVTDLRDIPFDPVPSKEMILKLLNSPIVHQIVEELHNQILAVRKQEILSREKESAKAIANKVFSPKLTDAAMAGKKPGCTLFIVEGDSASGGFKKHRLPDGTQGVLAMQGKSMGNVLYDDELRVSDRPAYATLMAAAGLSFMKKSKYRYDKYVLAQDADFDGNCITGLMLVFFVKFFPQVIREGRLFKLMTPIVIATKGNETKEYYEHKHYNNEKAFLEANGYTIKYNKGLGQIGDAQFKKLMQNPRLMPITLDDYADLSMFTWFGKHIDNKIMRKQYLIDAAGHNVDEETLQAAYDAVQMSQDLS